MSRFKLENCDAKLRKRIEEAMSNQVGGEVSHTKPKRDETPALGTAIQGETKSVQRVVVKFVGYRVKPLDPDNFAGSVKDLLDGLRHAGLIHGDEYWRIKLETEQVKVAHYEEEQTIITIDTVEIEKG